MRIYTPKELFEEIFNKLPFRPYIAIAGWPNTGKTYYISKFLQEEFEGSIVLDTTSVIRTRDYRAIHNLSGVNTKAHDFSMFYKKIESVLSFKPTRIKKYKYTNEENPFYYEMIQLQRDSVFVIDGPWTNHYGIHKRFKFDYVLFFYPLNEDQWIQENIKRDLKYRNYNNDSEEIARITIQHNIFKKNIDMKNFINDKRNLMTITHFIFTLYKNGKIYYVLAE